MVKKIFEISQYMAAVSLLVVFVIDILTPNGYEVDILYLCSILIVFKQNTRTILGFCLAACLLIGVDALFFDSGLSTFVWVNKGISIIAILITTYIAIKYRKLDFERAVKEEQYVSAMKEIFFITSHHVRKPVANILGLTEIICQENEDELSFDFKIHCGHLQVSASELDTFIKELTVYIEKTELLNQSLNG